MHELIAILIVTGKAFFGFILFIIALAISTLVFASFWFTVKYKTMLHYKIALENYRSKKSDERWAKRNHDHEDRDDD